ncbi:MAG: hypothetical protein K2P81_08120 [Bacteriovoracaceae bacterium]|nr:hypothetical protein [Bacteriovoracaceae bacterium]
MDISLTPSEIKEAESVFPGENWFCYWRTSAALWESKLAAINSNGGPIFIPLYWGFHTENGETFDFGEQKPEADLGRLFKAIKQSRHEALWLLPLTPIPIQPNGGLPSFMARNPSHDINGMTSAMLDSDGSIHKMHSFYDPRVYQAFRKWVWQLSQNLTQKSVATPMRGIRSYWVGTQTAHSYIEDYSPTYVAGFTRYLKQQKMPVRLNDEGVEVPNLDAEQSTIHTAKYRKLISDLYSQTASESLGGFWTGEQDYGFLGGAPQDIFPRSCELWPHQSELMQDLWTQLEWNLLPSSVLIPPKSKKGVIGKFLKDYLTPSYITKCLQLEMADNDAGNFTPLVFFDVFWDDDLAQVAPAKLESLGLLNHLQKDFKGCWRWRGRFDFSRESEDETDNRLKFFFGRQMDRNRFQQVLRLFLNGQKVVLDRSGLDPVLEKKLQLFMTENELVSQDVNFLTKVTLIRLGEGMLLLHNGDQLCEQPPAKKIAFWEHLTKYLNIRHLNITGSDEQLFYTWKTRASGSFELNYNEIRRLSFYNPLNQRVKCQIQGSKQFAFLKVVDPVQAQAKSTPMGIEIEVMAGGSISLDFGHFEG